MAKVDGPLFSLEARGKIADAIVFFPWKGRHAVRQWLKPSNPEKTLQGYVRAALKAIGKEVRYIQSKSQGNAVDSKLYLAEYSTKGAEDIWNAYHAAGLLKEFVVAGAFATTAMLAAIGEYSTHAATTAWNALATALGLVDFTFPYGYTTLVQAGCQLYFGALAAYNNGASWGTAFNQDPKTISAADVTLFAQAHTS